MRKKLISIIILLTLTLTLLASTSVYAANDRLKLSSESNLTLIQGNTYVTGICGTITADVLADNFDGSVSLTSPDGEALTGSTAVPSDSVVSNGSASVNVLIYGDVDRNGKLSLSDVSAMLKHISKWDIDICTEAVDLNWDNKQNLSDVSLLLKRIAGWNVCIGVDINPTQITLTYYDKDCTKIGVMWHSAKKTQTPAVQVAEGETDSFTDAVTVFGDTNVGIGDSNCRAVIEGLELGKTYSYRVGDASGFWSDSASFTLRDETEEEFTFICFTDTQSKDNNAGSCFRQAWRNAVTAYPEAELALHCGDVVENVGAADWSDMLDASAEYLRRIPMMVVSGNHETSYAGSMGYKMQYNHFYTHMPTQASYNDGYFYSFDYGDVHFVMLNTNKQGTPSDELSDEQITWLRADLEESTAKWTIVLMHHPVYSTGSGSTDRWEDPMVQAMQAQLSPIFAEYGVDVVLGGHDHIYYCTHPIDGEGNTVTDTATETVDGTVYYTDPAGVIYTTPGCTGSSSRSICDTHPEYYRATNDGIKSSYLAVKVEKDRLTVDLCIPAAFEETTVLDSWGIVK